MRHTYTEPGTYAISLQVDGEACGPAGDPAGIASVRACGAPGLGGLALAVLVIRRRR